MPDEPTPGDSSLQCPLPVDPRDEVQLAHGGGGRLMHQLIERIFARGFADPELVTDRDAAVLDIDLDSGTGAGRLAMTTDSYVVDPLFFPGGDIGVLAVHGTVNDLAMAGARPRYLSAGFILEEGLAMTALARIVTSMRAAAERAGVHIVTGDTKVVDRGKGDGVFINTTGVGVVAPGVDLGPRRVQPGDVVLASGDIGRHGMAILGVRQGLAFESEITSDTAALHHAVQALLDEGVEVRCLRDATRGGLATAVLEIAATAGLDVNLSEASIPVAASVAAACEILGLDPFYVANEGRMVAFVAPDHADTALAVLRARPETAGAAPIGEVAGAGGTVTLETGLGTRRVLDLLSGEQLPRIC